MTTDIRWFTSEMPGVTQFGSTPGDMIAVLNACLIDGFGVHTIDTMVSSSNVVTASVNAGHGYLVDQIIDITGATQPEYNGLITVLSVTATDFTYYIVGSPTSPATGTISAKVSPVGGWSKEYEDVPNHTVVYKSDVVTGSNYLYKFINDGSSHVRKVLVKGYQSMTDINTGVTYRDVIFNKAYAADNATTLPDQGRWVIVADKQLVHLFIHHGNDTVDHPTARYSYSHYIFGDIHSYIEGDSHQAILHGVTLLTGSNISTTVNISTNIVIARASDQVTKLKRLFTTNNRLHIQQASATDTGPYNKADGRIFFDKLYFGETQPNLFRGEPPGVSGISDTLLDSFSNKEIVVDDNITNGEKHLVILTTKVTSHTTPTTVSTGMSLGIQITGTWR